MEKTGSLDTDNNSWMLLTQSSEQEMIFPGRQLLRSKLMKTNMTTNMHTDVCALAHPHTLSQADPRRHTPNLEWLHSLLTNHRQYDSAATARL